MPDRRRGYVRRGEGVLPPDPEMARQYEEGAKQSRVEFATQVQRLMIEALIESCRYRKCRLHAVFFEPTHVHFLVSWPAEPSRGWLKVRAGLRQAMTLRLNERFGKREWFSGCGSRKQVRDREHFDFLMGEYRRKHSGLHWLETEDHAPG